MVLLAVELPDPLRQGYIHHDARRSKAPAYDAGRGVLGFDASGKTVQSSKEIPGRLEGFRTARSVSE